MEEKTINSVSAPPEMLNNFTSALHQFILFFCCGSV